MSHAAFEALLREYVTPASEVDYVASLATGSIDDDPGPATGYETEFRDYDWSLNGADRIGH